MTPNLLPRTEARTDVGDWALRAGIAVLFLLVGSDKFSSTPGSHWVTMFDQIGWGVWFRYFTGVVETAGAVLVLIPRTALLGFAMLGCAMAGAALILAFVLGRAVDSPFPAVLLIPLAAAAWKRWKIDRAKRELP